MLVISKLNQKEVHWDLYTKFVWGASYETPFDEVTSTFVSLVCPFGSVGTKLGALGKFRIEGL